MRYQCQKLGTNKIYDTTNIKTMINKQDILDVALQIKMPITDKEINYVLENYSETGEIWNIQVEDLLYQCEPKVCDHQLQTNFVGRTTGAYEYVGELNDLIGKNAFSCSTKRVDQSPQTEWIISGKDITSEEIERLNLHLDFIID